MSVNLRTAINEKKTKHLGPLFHTIDYDFDERRFMIGDKKIKFYPDDAQNLIYQCNDKYLRNENRIEINGFEFEVTKKELERIFETCENIKRIKYQRYRFFGL